VFFDFWVVRTTSAVQQDTIDVQVWFQSCLCQQLSPGMMETHLLKMNCWNPFPGLSNLRAPHFKLKVVGFFQRTLQAVGFVLILGGLTSCWEILLPHTSPTGLTDPPLLPSFYLPTGRHSFSQFLVS